MTIQPPPDACPDCGAATEREAVDVGVGTVYSPAYCVDCGWQEPNDVDPFTEPDLP